MEVISWKNMPIFNEIILLLIRQNTIPYGQRHLELCFVINLTKMANGLLHGHQYLQLGVLVLLLPFYTR